MSDPQNNSISTPDSTWPHRLAVLLACATFPMVFVGALVTTKKAGMAVEGWPTTFGRVWYPIALWFSSSWNFFVEHGHRLIGWFLVGPLTIALCVTLLIKERRLWVRAVGLFALELVIFQGVLGGMRVRLDQLQLAKIHGCVGPLFFATAVAIAVFTSRLWRSAEPPVVDVRAGGLQRLALLTTLLAYLQLIAGAELRHMAPDASPGTFRVAVWFHLGLAAVLTVHVLLLLVRVLWHHRGQAALRRPTVGLALLLFTQLVLGASTWIVKHGWPGDIFAGWPLVAGWVNEAGTMGQSLIITGHVAVGSLILATSLLIALRSLRLLSTPLLSRERSGEGQAQRRDIPSTSPSRKGRGVAVSALKGLAAGGTG